MRSPIQDGNAGAATQVAPTKKHAIRTATVARHNNNSALMTQQNINTAASGLGNALGRFMSDKRTTEMEQRYQQAYHDQGTKEGLEEYQKDLKRTGFTEFIYGGQSPEYLGALHASARNASNAMYVEEAQFIEGEGGDLTPAEYQQRIQEKITDYNKENFSDAPDAAFAFMQNWRDNSNELSKQQFKLYQVREQEKARRTVADGWQGDLSVYKSMVSSNPEKAQQIGRDMYSGKYKPAGMSDGAYRDVIIKESFNAARAGDYSALKLLNESGLQRTFNDKELKEYNTVRGIVDTSNQNTLESARLRYETAVETGSANEVEAAKSMYASVRQQVAARDTGSTEHWKNVFGADRWRGALGNQYKTRLKTEAKEWTAEQVNRVVLNEAGWESQMWSAEPADRRGMLADRLDDLLLASYAPDLDPKVRQNLQEQFTKGKELLETWESTQATEERKANQALATAQQEEAAIQEGVLSLMTGNGFTVTDNKNRKRHMEEAMNVAVDRVLPEVNGTTLDKLNQIWQDPMLTDQFIRTTGGFGMAVGDADSVKTSIKNLSLSLRQDNELHKFTPEQQQQASTLTMLRERNATLFNAAFPEIGDRAQVNTMIRAIENDAHIDQTNNMLEEQARRSGTSTPLTIQPDKLIEEMSLSSADPEIMSMAVDEYKANAHLGHSQAKRLAQEYINSMNVKVDGKQIINAGTFEKINDMDLGSIAKIMDKKIKLPDGTVATGWTMPMSNIVKNEGDANANRLYTLRQMPSVKLRVVNNQLVLTQSDGRVYPIPREYMESYINEYTRQSTRSVK